MVRVNILDPSGYSGYADTSTPARSNGYVYDDPGGSCELTDPTALLVGAVNSVEVSQLSSSEGTDGGGGGGGADDSDDGTGGGVAFFSLLVVSEGSVTVGADVGPSSSSSIEAPGSNESPDDRRCYEVQPQENKSFASGDFSDGNSTR
jgi:hypothetical protein